MKVTSAAKVGFTAILLVLVLAVVYRGLGWPIPGFSGKSSDYYKIYVKFDTVKGLDPGGDVQLNGNPIGEVEEIDNSQYGEVKVTLKIKSDKVIHKHAKFAISRDSIFGSYLVSITESGSGEMETEVNANNEFTVMVRTDVVEQGGKVYMVEMDGREIGDVVNILPGDTTRFVRAVVRLNNDEVRPTVATKLAFVPWSEALEMPGSTGDLVIYDSWQPGSEVQDLGEREAGPEDLVASASDDLQKITTKATELMDKLGVLLDQVSLALEPEEIKATLKALSSEATAIANNINALTTKLNNLLDETEPHLIATTENIETLTGNASELVDGLSQYNDPEFRANIEQIVANLTAASDSLTLILADIQGLTGDDVMMEDIKAAIHEARYTIEEARGTLGAAETAIENVSTGMNIFGGIESSAEFMLRDATEEDRWSGDLNARVGFEGGDTFLETGIDDIGEDDLWNAQIGWWIEPDISGRIGIHRGKIGVGSEWRGDTIRVKTDLYDLNDLQWDLYAGYAIIPELDIMIGVEDLLDNDELNFGLAVQF